MTERVTPPWEAQPATPPNHTGEVPIVEPAPAQGAPQPEAQPKTKGGNPKWVKGMKSPCPTGRPRGIVDKRMRVIQALEGDAHAVTRVVIDAALAGDMQAAGIVMARISPALKSQAQTVQFDFNAEGSLTEQVRQILQGIADGNVPPDVGRQIVEAVASLSAVKQLEEVEARLTALEKGRRA